MSDLDGKSAQPSADARADGESRARFSVAAGRGALVGALGGVVAGAADFGAAFARAATYLPSGRGRLLLFLCTFYGAAFAAVGALVGVLVAALDRTDLGILWRQAGGGAERVGARRWSYVVAALLLAVAIGGAVDVITLLALRQFHQPVLIAGLVAGAANGMALAALLLAFPLAALLSLIPVGGRVVWRGASAVGVLVLTVGAGLGAGAVGLTVRALLDRPRMTPAVRALNVGLWTPALLLLVLPACWLVLRLLKSRRGSPLGFAAAVLVGAALVPAIYCVYAWNLVRQLDGRPLVAVAVAALAALAALLVGVARPTPTQKPLRSVAALLLIPLLFVSALHLARADRVRKAALTYTGLTPPLVQALQHATDFDGDGYSSLTSLGGGDCNDFDARIHPGAFDWPDNRIDEDCNGQDATLPTAHLRQKWPLPDSVVRTPNVLLITIDALRADHVGAYGYTRPTTPTLDALAAESTRFAHAWSHAPSTRYSVPAILTGLYPLNVAVGSAHWPPNILPENHLLAEMLKPLGYFTGATLSYYYFERAWGLDQGFDDYDDHLKYLHSGPGVDPSKTHGTSARELADLDVAFIQKHAQEKFFLWTHYYDTHFDFMKHDEPETHFGSSDGNTDNEIDIYDGEIRYTDLHLQRVFAALRAAGLWDKTIIIVTSDHGDGFGEHGIPKDKRHGYHLYKNETSVPLIIHVPGLPARVVDEPVGHIDVIPTLLDLLDVKAGEEPQLMGESLLGLMTGVSHEPDRHVFQEVDYEGPTKRRAVVNHDWHYIKNVIPDDTSELFHLAADPLEEHDLAGDGEAEETKLQQQLGAWMDLVNLPRDFARRVAGNLSTSALPFATPLGDRLGSSIALDGINLPTPTVARGAAVSLDVVMHGLSPVPAGWRLFTHVMAANGRLLNADHEPLEGAFPIAELRAGQWLRDQTTISLPLDWPAGVTTVEMGLWKGPARAPATGPHAAADFVRVATFRVNP